MQQHPSHPDPSAAAPATGVAPGIDASANSHSVPASVVVVSPVPVPGPGQPSSSALIARFPWHLHVPILFIAAMVTLAFGLTLPVMTVEGLLVWDKDYTLVTGARGLWDDGEHFLATVLLLFSGVFPVIKLLLLGALLVLPMRPRPRARLIDITDAVGRWSMLDVFVVALFIVLARSALIAKAAPAPGLYVFCAAIVLSMLLSLELRRLSRRAAL